MKSEISLKEFIAEYGDIIKQRVKDRLTPVFQKSKLDDWDMVHVRMLSRQLSRKPFQAQAESILAISKGLYKADKRSAVLVGEMGSGKTLMGIGIAALIPKENCRILIICPSHLAKKWEREIRSTDRHVKSVKILSNISDVDFKKPNGREYWIVPKERSKLHYAEKKAYIYHRRKGLLCPQCYAPVDEENVNDCCCKCGSQFSTVDRSKYRRYAIAEYIKRHKGKCHIELLIADEVHELKGGDTAQGQAFHALCTSANKIIALTGTLMGGYSSNLYFLLYRLFTRQMVKAGYKHNSSVQFSNDYGIVEITVESVKSTCRTASIGATRDIKRVIEKPGVSPLLLPHFLLENSVYVWISDIAEELPRYDEIIELVQMRDEQKFEYDNFQHELMLTVQEALQRKDMRLLGALVNSLFALPDGARRGEVVLDPNGLKNGVEIPLCSAQALDIPLLPKEERLIQIVKEEQKAGRKVAIFLEHTGTRDLIPDITERLGNYGVKSLILRSDTVPTLKREEWLIKNIKDQNPDVLICNPNLVKTGLDLLDFPTIIFFQTGFNIYTLRQSSRRSWRIGQNNDVKVIYMAYEATAQERALKLIATKLETSNAVEGKLAADGLTSMSSSDSSLMYAIARELVDGKNSNDKSLKSAWNDYKKSEVTKEESLSDNENVLKNILNEIAERKGLGEMFKKQVAVMEVDLDDVMLESMSRYKPSSKQLTIEDFLFSMNE